MSHELETMRAMVALQGFLTLILVALFWTLYTRFRRADFFRLWCGAWIVYGLGLAAGRGIVELGAPPNLLRSALVLLFAVFGFVQAALIFLGARAFAREEQPSKQIPVWLGAAALLGSLVFLVSVTIAPQIGAWLGQPESSGAPAPNVLRIVPRQAVIAIAYLAATWIFWSRRKTSRLPAPQILAFTCLLYGSFQAVYAASLASQYQDPNAVGLAYPPYFFDIASQILFALGVVLFLLDEYRRVLESRSEVEARFGGVAQSLAEGLLITDPDDVILFANDRIAQMTGHSVEELTGRPAYMLLLAEKNWPFIWRKNKDRLAGIADRYEIELRRKDGATLWVEISASPYRNITGQITGTLGAITDITERRQYARALAASEEKFSKAFLSSPDPVSIAALADGRLLDVNESYCKATGYSREELLGRSSVELGLCLHPEERDRMWQLLQTQKRLSDFPMRFRRKNGEDAEGLVSAELMEIGGQTCVLGITRDVTATRRIERRENALFEIAWAADRAPSLEALFQEVHRIVRQVMSAENFYIALYDESTDTLSFPYFVDQRDQPSPPGPLGRGNTAYVLRTGFSLLSPVEVHEELKRRGEVDTVGIMSEVWLGVPLKVGEKCIGVMAVQHYTDRKAYGEPEQRTLEYVSSQVATAIQRRRAEEALRGSEEKFSRAFHSSPDGMTISRVEDSRFLEVNQSFLRMMGYTREEVIGHNSLELHLWVHPEKRPEMQHALRQSGRVEEFELELKRKDGGLAVGLLSVDVIEVEGQKCFLSVVRDITARKKMEEALRASEAKFSKAFFASPDAMVISTIDTSVFVDVNDGFCKLSGFDRAEVIGRSSRELGLWTSEGDRARVVEALRRGQQLRNLEFRFRSKSGRMIVGLLSADVIAFAGQECMLAVVRDITERKEMEEALRTSEERFRELFENANDLVYTHDLEGNFTSLNRTGERITEYSREEALRLNMKDLLDPQQLEFARRMVAAKIDRKGPTTYELQIRSKNGRPIDLEVSTRIIQFDGKPIGVQGIARDVTERRKGEQALRDSEERYRLLFQNSPLPMMVYEVESLQFLAVNDAAIHSYGFSRSEFLSMTIKDIRPPDEIPYLIRRLTSEPMEQHVAVHRKKDGSLIDVEIRAHSLGWFGKGARMVVAEDITERVRAEIAIRESEAKFRTLAESSPYAIVITRDQQVVFANRAAVDMSGYTLEELFQLDTNTFLTPEMRTFADERRAQRDQSPWRSMRYELKVTAKGGVEKWLDITTSQITYEGSPAVLLNAMDVTERKVVEEQLRQAQKMEAVGRLAGGVAHDFNNLLMIMRGYADLILDSESADESTRRNAEQITRASERAAGLTQQLLAFSRKQVLAPQVLNLPQVIQGVDKMLVRLIGENIELTTSAPEDLWRVKADPNQIEQVLLNLAINARDAMPQGGKLMIEMSNVNLDAYFVRQHAGSTAGPHVLISVSDTGAGMTREVSARVFEPFFTTKEVGRGTGLGLATVYGIVKQSNGYITVYSEAGKGTTFKVYLPKATEEATPVALREPSEHLGGSETILLVEDETDVRALARQFLDSRGYRVLEAKDGSEALTISGGHSGNIDLLVTDVVMPKMSGRELAEKLAPIRPHMRVLYVSGYTAEAIGHHGILDPGTEFLQKPFSREILARKLREVLDKRR